MKSGYIKKRRQGSKTLPALILNCNFRINGLHFQNTIKTVFVIHHYINHDSGKNQLNH
jgi:hypothetical protein